jgi:hypothetical protein
MISLFRGLDAPSRLCDLPLFAPIFPAMAEYAVSLDSMRDSSARACLRVASHVVPDIVRCRRGWRVVDSKNEVDQSVE